MAYQRPITYERLLRNDLEIYNFFFLPFRTFYRANTLQIRDSGRRQCTLTHKVSNDTENISETTIIIETKHIKIGSHSMWIQSLFAPSDMTFTSHSFQSKDYFFGLFLCVFPLGIEIRKKTPLPISIPKYDESIQTK